MIGRSNTNLRLGDARSRRTRPTRHGVVAALLSLLVAAAAANTGANLLFLVLGLLIGALIYAWWAQRRVLAGAVLRLELPELVEAGAEFPGQLVLEAAAGPVVVHARRLLPRRGVFAAGGTTAFTAAAPARQVIERLEIEVTTTWPFHLWRQSVAAEVAVGTHVHPSLRRGRGIERRRGREGEHDAEEAGHGGSLRDVRDYVPGDSPRRVHWPLSARQGRMVVREDHAETRPRAVLQLPTRLRGARLEAALSDAASRLRDAILSGCEVRLVGPAVELHLSGPAGLGRGLRLLAGYGTGPRSPAGEP